MIAETVRNDRPPGTAPPVLTRQGRKENKISVAGAFPPVFSNQMEGYEMIKEIKKPTSRQMVEAIKAGNFSTVDEIKATAKKDARKVFDAIASGAVPLIWYDLPPVRCRSGAVSVMRYALHRSPKKVNHLQLSCMELKNGHTIPTSDRQYNIMDGSGFSEFFQDLPGTTNINYLEQ